MAIDVIYWKNLDETKEVIKMIDKEIEAHRSALLDGQGILMSSQLERDYCYAKGLIEGLKFIQQLIEEARYDRNSGEDEAA